MKKSVATCGLVCTECPAFTGNYDKTQEEQDRMNADWPVKHVFKTGDPPCEGCHVKDGRLIEFCADCEVRFCGFDKNVRNCAHCDEYPCEKLAKLWKAIRTSVAKSNLDDIRGSL